MPKLAPGVLKVIPGEPSEEDAATGPIDFVEVSRVSPNWTPNFAPPSETLVGMAETTTFRRSVWQLEFAFKPVRMLTLPIDNGDGTAGARRVWYLLYRIRNTGGNLKPVPEKDEFGHDRFVLKPDQGSLRFIPMFVLQCHEFDKSYADRVMPEVVQKIHSIEIRDPAVKLYDSVTITEVPLETSSDAVAREVWGVATWDNVERRTDFFSIFVQGLTNAYRWENAPADKQGFAAGRKYFFKSLQLNFYRPGDAVHEQEDEFRFGLPLASGEPDLAILKTYGVAEPVDYTWVYRP